MPEVTKVKLAEKKEIKPKTYIFKFTSEKDLKFEAGQYFTLVLRPGLVRSYSIVDIAEKIITFTIDTTVGGEASKFFETTEAGIEINAIGPIGLFKLVPSNNPKVFIATGTGLAPFVSMIKKVYAENPDADVSLFFGCRYVEDDYTETFFDYEKRLRIYPCITRSNDEEVALAGKIKGRVTEILPKQNFDWQNTDFYLCGNPQMVEEMRKILESLNAKNVYFEKY